MRFLRRGMPRTAGRREGIVTWWRRQRQRRHQRPASLGGARHPHAQKRPPAALGRGRPDRGYGPATRPDGPPGKAAHVLQRAVVAAGAALGSWCGPVETPAGSAQTVRTRRICHVADHQRPYVGLAIRVAHRARPRSRERRTTCAGWRRSTWRPARADYGHHPGRVGTVDQRIRPTGGQLLTSDTEDQRRWTLT